MKQPASVRTGPGLSRRASGSARREHVAFNANPLLAVKLPAWRSKLVLFLLFCGFIALAGRAVILQGDSGSGNELRNKGEARYARTLDLPATRGRIVDRNGVVLAASVPARAVWAIPDDVDANPQQIEALARLLQVPAADLKRRLGTDRSFVYLRRQVDPDVAQKIEDLKLEGIHQSREFRRQYPEGVNAAHLIGFTDVDDHGKEGIELALDKTLAGRSGHRRVIKDRLGRIVEENWGLDPIAGNDVTLSIDSRIQYLAQSALQSALDINRAKAGSVLVLDVRTGEVLALASLPGYDPNGRGSYSPDAMRDRAVADTFEPGSTMKPFSIATAIDTGVVAPTTKINTAPGRLTIGNRTIHDSHAHGVLTVEEVLAKSSNIGTTKIALQMPAKRLWETYAAVGFGLAPRIDLPGAATGRLRPYAKWQPIEQATISYGYGVSVSLLQLARAYTMFAREGDVVPLSLLRRDGPVAGVQVIKPETAREMRRMLEMAVSDQGTAPRARIAGYRVAGKTGTAHKLRNGRYSNAYVASFAGFAPASNPRIVVAVMVDEPNGTTYYGGDVAAPVFAKVAAATLRTLQILPDSPNVIPQLPAQPLEESL
jgi:cell division protein FtsI (penicillin-binding protein 3)